jgi:hypothetical protein
MGLLDKLTIQGGSVYSYGNGQTPTVNPGATQQSKLHADGAGQPGYSVNGTDASYVNSLYQGYEDGKNTPIPEPTQLDLTDPTTADPDNKPKYTPIPGQTYSDLYNKF